MNGPDACKAMRNLGCSSYIAGVTGNVLSEDVCHFRDCGANCVLPKPFRLVSLEEQWVENGVTPITQSEKQGIVRVESGGKLVEMGDELALSLSNHKSPSRMRKSKSRGSHENTSNCAALKKQVPSPEASVGLPKLIPSESSSTPFPSVCVAPKTA